MTSSLNKVPLIGGQTAPQPATYQRQWNDRILRGTRCDDLPLVEAYPWQPIVRQRLDEVVGLQRGWDGYTGIGVSYTNAVFAEQLISAVCHSCNVQPQIVPGSRGDLYVEWHSLNGDVELHVVGPYKVYGTYEHMITGELVDNESFSSDFSKVSHWLKEISEEYSHDRAAA